MTNRRKKLVAASLILIVFGMAAIATYKLLLRPAVELSMGNYRIDYYGRVVDEAGNGVEGVAITFRIIYSGDVAKPGMFGRGESFKFVTVNTDRNGDFAVERQYGYVIEGFEGKRNGNKIALRAKSLAKSDDPLYGVRMDSLSSRRKLPDTPSKRVTSNIVPLDYPL